MPPLIRPAGHLLPLQRRRRLAATSQPDLASKQGTFLLPAAGETVRGEAQCFHLRCTLRPVDKNRQKP
ncbi:hypothetical protein BS630_20365 [Rhizobium laguerreae]|nr:hypothetical protein BS630_20365 [Rhizobium laguerreae]